MTLDTKRISFRKNFYEFSGPTVLYHYERFRRILPKLSREQIQSWGINKLDDMTAFTGLTSHTVNAAALFLQCKAKARSIAEARTDSTQILIGWQFKSAFGLAGLALEEAGIDAFPIKGALIAMLRYGDYPLGQAGGHFDVVDNDGEYVILVEKESEISLVKAKIQRILRSLGWPPCGVRTHPSDKLECHALQYEVPLKLEFYFFMKSTHPETGQSYYHVKWKCGWQGDEDICLYDSKSNKHLEQDKILSGEITATQDHAGAWPFPQFERGAIPANIILPFSRCKLGDTGVTLPCPAQPVRFLREWGGGLHGANDRPYEDVDGALWRANTTTSQCTGFPLVTKDREPLPQSKRIAEQGITPEFASELYGIAQELSAQGFESFKEEFREPRCNIFGMLS